MSSQKRFFVVARNIYYFLKTFTTKINDTQQIFTLEKILTLNKKMLAIL